MPGFGIADYAAAAFSDSGATRSQFAANCRAVIRLARIVEIDLNGTVCNLANVVGSIPAHCRSPDMRKSLGRAENFTVASDARFGVSLRVLGTNADRNWKRWRILSLPDHQ